MFVERASPTNLERSPRAFVYFRFCLPMKWCERPARLSIEPTGFRLLSVSGNQGNCTLAFGAALLVDREAFPSEIVLNATYKSS